MKFFLSGYGKGPFSTLEWGVDADEDAVSAKKTAIVFTDGRASAGVQVQGVGEEAASLILWDMSRDEALLLAQRLIDYARMPHHKFKADRPRSKSKTYTPID